MVSRRWSTEGGAIPRQRSPMRFSATISRGRRQHGRWHRHHLRTIRRRMAASSTTRPMADKLLPASPAGSRAGQLASGPTGLKAVSRIAERGRDRQSFHDYMLGPYVDDLAAVVEMDTIAHLAKRRSAPIRAGGAGIAYWGAIVEHHGVQIQVVQISRSIRRFGFMPLDWDGKIRMDCSSPMRWPGWCAAERFDIAFSGGNATTTATASSAGLMNPNHFRRRRFTACSPRDRTGAPMRRSANRVVSSSMIDRVAGGSAAGFGGAGRLHGFVDGLLLMARWAGGEAQGGLRFLRRDGGLGTDRMALIMDLLAVELWPVAARLTRTGLYADLTAELGAPLYARIVRRPRRHRKPRCRSCRHAMSGPSAGRRSDSGDAHTAPNNGAAIMDSSW